MIDASWLRVLEPLLFAQLAQLVSGKARSTVEAIAKAHREGTSPTAVDLAVVVDCDERNIRNHLNDLEAGIKALAGSRSVAEFTFEERGPGKKVPIKYTIRLNAAFGHSERLLFGFRSFGSEKPDGAVLDGVDIYILRRNADPASYSAGSVELANALADSLREPDWRPRIHYRIQDFDEEVRTSTRPVIVLCGTEDLPGVRMPDFASLTSESAEGAKPHEIASRRYDYVLLTRFVNDCGQPVLIIRSDYRFGHLAFKALIDNNASAGMIWNQLALDDDALAPKEYQFRFRVEMHAHKNIPAGHGDPQVMRPYHFSPPARPKPVRPEPGAPPKLGVVRR